MIEVLYLSVPFEEVKEIFPYARVVDGRAILPLAQIKYLKGVHDIEVIGAHDADLMIAELQEHAGAEDVSPVVDEGVAAGSGGEQVPDDSGSGDEEPQGEAVEIPQSEANTVSDAEPTDVTQAEVIEHPTAEVTEEEEEPQEVETNDKEEEI